MDRTALHLRRYSSWLLGQEAQLTRKRELSGQLIYLVAGLIALAEALFPWQASYTPLVPAWAHIAATALLLPVLYFVSQADYRHKLASFTNVMNELGRRLLFLDPTLDVEQFEVLEQFHGAILSPTQRYFDRMLKTTGRRTLRERVHEYYRAFPSPLHEGDRMGLLSVLHPKTALSWLAALTLIWICLPGVGVSLGASSGLTFLPLLLPLYLTQGHLNTRYAYETALHNWLRLG